MAASVDPATRKKVLRVVFISLLLDLVRSHYLAGGAIARLVLGASLLSLLTQLTDQLYLHPPVIPTIAGILSELRSAAPFLLYE